MAILDSPCTNLEARTITFGRRIVGSEGPVRFVLTGSVLAKDARIQRRLAEALKASWRGAEVEVLRKEGAWGAVALAREAVKDLPSRSRVPSVAIETAQKTKFADWAGQSPTEQRNHRSRKLDRMKLGQAIEL